MNSKLNRWIVVPDTNIFYAALFGSGRSRDDWQILDMEKRGLIRFAFSPKTLNELYKIFCRTVEAHDLLNCHQIFLHLCTITSRSILLEPSRQPRISSDPSDQMFVDLAVAVNARYHITRDTKNGLLDQKSFQGTRFVTPAQFLKQFRQLH